MAKLPIIKLSSILLLFAVVISPAQASEVNVFVTSAHVDDLVLSRCGTQATYFSGTASYGIPGKLLAVTIDGQIIFTRPGTQADGLINWLTDAITLTPGQHFVRAAVLDSSNVVVGAHGFFFDVPACPVPTPTPTPTPAASSNEGANSGGGGGGEEPQPEAKKGQVKGVVSPLCTRAKDGKAKDFIQNAAVPAIVDRLFTSVFNRKIIHAESTYWKGRARCDKATETKLIGAMQFHKSRGVTMPGIASSDPETVIDGSIIPNTSVPAVVEREFMKVFSRKPTVAESTYWKSRARSDKKTIGALSGAMLFHKAKGKTMVSKEVALGL